MRSYGSIIDNLETVVTILQTMLQDENRIYKQQ